MIINYALIAFKKKNNNSVPYEPFQHTTFFFYVSYISNKKKLDDFSIKFYCYTSVYFPIHFITIFVVFQVHFSFLFFSYKIHKNWKNLGTILVLKPFQQLMYRFRHIHTIIVRMCTVSATIIWGDGHINDFNCQLQLKISMCPLTIIVAETISSSKKKKDKKSISTTKKKWHAASKPPQ